MAKKTGVLVTGFGGPDSIEACAPFMRNLMGREPSEELVERVKMRYLSIGGESPLPETAASIAEKLAEALGEGVPVRVGMRYWHPFIAEAMGQLVEDGAERIVTVSLSPFESKVATGAYREAVAEAAEALGGIEVVEAPPVGDVHGFCLLLAEGCRRALDDLREMEARAPLVVFTAHSLPVADLAEDDPYVSGLEDTANTVAQLSGLAAAARADLGGHECLGSLDGPGEPWVFCYQSKGDRPGEWLGPSVEEVVQAAIAAGYGSVAACPIGFVTDHMETLYDLDVEVADMVLLADMEFARGAVPNDRKEMIAVFASVVQPFL